MYFNYSEAIGASGAGGLDNKTSIFPKEKSIQHLADGWGDRV